MQINLTDRALFEGITGAGASYTYDWYRRFSIDEEALTVAVHIENGMGGVESATLTPAGLRRAVDAVIEANPGGGTARVDWADPECDSDIDADIADCIMQTAVLGEVVYG